MTPPSSPSERQPPTRDSGGRPLAPLGRLFLWCPTSQTQSKLVAHLREHGLPSEVAEGSCVIVDLEWDTLHDLVIPIRRILTHRESDEVRVLYRPGGGGLTTADLPKVQSYTQFSSVSQSSWLNDMLMEHRLTSVLQPIVHADRPSKVFAHEALLRGVGRDEAIVYPNYIFGVARGCGMLVPLELAARKAAVDRMVLDQVNEALFINVTPSVIEDPISSLEGTVEIIDEANIAHERIVFEVVETDQAHNVHHLHGMLAYYRDAGFRVALDDVGAGYSSLNLLHQLRPDFVKLDMDLIRDVDHDPYKSLIASKIIEIATALDIETIAEGIETPEELAWARGNGATYAQGYAIARPTVPTFVGRTPVGIERLVS